MSAPKRIALLAFPRLTFLDLIGVYDALRRLAPMEIDRSVSVKLIGTSSIGESTIPGVSGALYRDIGVQVDHAFRRWLIGSLAVMLPTGFLLFMASAVKCYHLPVFWVKMTALALALAFTFAVRRPAILSEHLNPGWGKVIALVSLALWLSVAVTGRLVGFP
jgi:hypothetical protein